MAETTRNRQPCGWRCASQHRRFRIAVQERTVSCCLGKLLFSRRLRNTFSLFPVRSCCPSRVRLLQPLPPMPSLPRPLPVASLPDRPFIGRSASQTPTAAPCTARVSICNAARKPSPPKPTQKAKPSCKSVPAPGGSPLKPPASRRKSAPSPWPRAAITRPSRSA